MGGQDGDLVLFDLKMQKQVHSVPLQDRIVYKVKWFKNHWVACTDDGQIRVFNQDLELIFEQQIAQREIRTFDITSQGKVFLSPRDPNIQLFQLDLEAKKLVFIKELEGHADIVSSIQINESKNLLLSGSMDHSFFVWGLNSLSFKHNLIGHRDLISSSDSSTSGEWLITGSWDQTCCLFDAKSISD